MSASTAVGSNAVHSAPVASTVAFSADVPPTDAALSGDFGQGGIVRLQGWTSVLGIAELADGRLLVRVQHTTQGGVVDADGLVRLFADGAIDPSFASGGASPGTITLPSGTGRQIVLRSDGRILLGDGAVRQFTAEGVVDPSFASGSPFTLSSGPVFELDDSSLMLTSLNGASGGGLLLRHMSSSGALLPGGQLPTDVPASAVAVARLLDGSWRLVVAGRAGEGPSDNQSRVVALTTAGALDPAFGGGDGVADLGTVAATGFGAPAPMAAALPDGRLLAAFNLFVDGYEVVRLSDTGELEPTFGLNGRMSRAPTSPQGGDLLSLVADANGAMTLSITQRFDDPARSPYSSTLSRTTANGEIDGAFHPRGSRPGSVWLQELGVAGQAVGGTMVALRSGSVLVAATQSDPAFGVPSVAQIVRVQLPPRSRITAVAGAAQGSAPAVRAMNAHQG